ncbi:MAG: Dam family site-specific DNA-(adenine-N6)-methyltransferase [Deltaproteobacteria bacterium]|jgi:DNA adenine methylase|nr:Dam family site-specific DNA-(adenine-N6)-methyltransferase [Deltaproteobacteria bacterium]
MSNRRRSFKANPFIKWAGGKSQILEEIKKKFPSGLGDRYSQYAEPFIGGGAVLLEILNNYQLTRIYISDINRELVHAYKTIRDNVKELIELLLELEERYLPANSAERKDIFYQSRDRFNALKAGSDLTTELAALFIFLNRTCFNGLYRVNAKGGFNVPQGRYKNPKICDSANLLAVSAALEGVEIVWGDYQLSSAFIDERTFAYFDPPYRPLSNTANFTSYAKDEFGDQEQIELAHFIDAMRAKGAWVVASNSDPKNSDINDNFFDNLYSKHHISRIEASRAINSHGDSRGRVREILISPHEE